MAKHAKKNPSQLLEPTADVANATASSAPKNVLSTLPAVINFYHTGKGFYLGKFVYFSTN